MFLVSVFFIVTISCIDLVYNLWSFVLYVYFTSYLPEISIVGIFFVFAVMSKKYRARWFLNLGLSEKEKTHS